ncbi:MAG: dienelactone hydrolase family protein [Trueperaceae bacterium]|nr:dienelactone hydrolase family protein [Trueperaceae bacterium]
MNKLELQPAHELWQQYKSESAPYAFKANTANEAIAWQKAARQAFRDTLGFQDFSAPLEVEILEQTDKGSYIREKILLRTAEHSIMPVYLLMPKDKPRPMPTVLAFHGHGYGVKDIVSIWEDGTDRDGADGIYKDFALELCRQGFAVAAPEISCFGERQTDFSYLKIGQNAPSSCMHAAMLASHLGGSVAGIRVRDSRRLIDYLETRPEFDTSRLGSMGLSGGGMVSMFTTCADERIKACVISGYFSSFQHSIHAMHHCGCNYVHNLHQFGEIYDLAGLIAPRPLFVEAGTHDPIFPIEAVKNSVAKTNEIYKLFSAQGVQTDYFQGRHRIEATQAYPFLKAVL